MADAPQPHVMPHLDIEGAAAALEFYRKAFGAVEVTRLPAQDGKRLMHAAIRIGDGMVMLHDSFPEYAEMGGTNNPKALGKSTVTIHLYAPDVDKIYKQAIDSGATGLMSPKTCSGATATPSCATRSATSGRWARRSKNRVSVIPSAARDPGNFWIPRSVRDDGLRLKPSSRRRRRGGP